MQMDFYSTEKTLGNVNAKILEINSKTGLYPLYCAYSIFRAKQLLQKIQFIKGRNYIHRTHD